MDVVIIRKTRDEEEVGGDKIIQPKEEANIMVLFRAWPKKLGAMIENHTQNHDPAEIIQKDVTG